MVAIYRGGCVAELLAKRALDLIGQRFDQVRNYSSVACLDEGLNRHARDKLDRAEARHLFRRHCDPDGVVALVCALIGGDVRGDLADAAENFWSCPRIECREAERGT